MDLNLPGARISLYRHWWLRDTAERLQTALRDEVLWEVHRIRMFGRWVDSPRLSCWMGDPQAGYRYSGVTFTPLPWLPVLAPLRERLEAETGHSFNSVLLNRYRDGRDCMGWHSDDEPELGSQPMIASLSLGATRRFLLKHRAQPAVRLALELQHGDLLLMGGDTQRNYRHALPRTARPVGERINLTFRQILPGR
ncbi:MAG: alpha-ketoglutarate-dependent dioxygenase AlkB family protein [Stenotrophomonas sp.]